jgi:hypothetical protein
MAFPIPEEPVIKTTLLIVAFIGLTKNKKSSEGRLLCLNSKIETEIFQIKKMASDLHRTAQPRTLAMFPSWESAGAGRVGLAGANISFYIFTSALSVKITLYIGIFKIHTMKIITYYQSFY